MTCDDYQIKISSLLDGEVPAADSGEIFSHMGSCADCRLFWHNTLALNGQLEIVSRQVARQITVSSMPKRTSTISAWWNRPIPIRAYLVSLFLCALIGLSFLTIKPHLFGSPETIYVTKLPAVVVTSEIQVVHTRTEGELQ
jgi:predicted anti-sigma-YlaC factor YlaD